MLKVVVTNLETNEVVFNQDVAGIALTTLKEVEKHDDGILYGGQAIVAGQMDAQGYIMLDKNVNIELAKQTRQSAMKAMESSMSGMGIMDLLKILSGAVGVVQGMERKPNAAESMDQFANLFRQANATEQSNMKSHTEQTESKQQ